MLNKKSRTDARGWSSNLGVEWGAKNSSPPKRYAGPRTCQPKAGSLSYHITTRCHNLEDYDMNLHEVKSRKFSAFYAI
jgi:hypothetical protein